MALKDSFTVIRFFTSTDIYFFTTDNRPLTDLKTCLDFLADTIDARGGWTLISTGTASNSTTLDFTGLTGFSAYWFIITDPLVPVTNAVDLWLRISQDNGVTFKANATDYVYSSYEVFSSNTSGINSASTGAPQLILASTVGNSASNGIGGSVRVAGLASTTKNKRIVTLLNRFNGTNHAESFGGGNYVTDQNAINAVRFLFSSGNISTGTVKCYGLLP